MAKLYGTLQGNRSEKTCCGSASSGLKVSAQSWYGSLITYVNLNDEGKPIFSLYASEGSANSCFDSKKLFEGTLEELKAKLKA